MQVYLIRHTTPKIEKGICYGQSDIPIRTDSFKNDVDIIKSKIGSSLQHVFSSPLHRCLELSKQLHAHVTIDNRLKELHFGNWELTQWNNIPPNELNIWMSDFINFNPPNGESYNELFHRTFMFLQDLMTKDLNNVGIVTHAGNIRSILSHLLSLPLKNTFKIQLNYGCVVSIELNKNSELCSLKHIK